MEWGDMTMKVGRAVMDKMITMGLNMAPSVVSWREHFMLNNHEIKSSLIMIFLFFHSIPNVDVLQVDVTNEAHIAKAAEHVKQKYGKLELLINNAGLLHPSGLYLVNT